jgi:hypothetical protein
MHKPENQVEIFFGETLPTNQVHENQCVVLTGEYCETIYFAFR